MDFAEFAAMAEDMVVNTWKLSKIPTDNSDNSPTFVYLTQPDIAGKQGIKLVMLADMSNQEKLSLGARTLRSLVYQDRAPHSCFAFEGWGVSATLEQYPEIRAYLDGGGRLCNHPLGVEVLTLQFATVEVPHNQNVTFHVMRDNEAPYLLKQPSPDNADPSSVTGRFVNLYYPAVLDSM